MVVGEHGRCVDQEAFTVVSLFARVCVLVHVYVCCLRRLFYFFDNCCLSFCFCLFFLATVLCFSNLKFECLHFVCVCFCAVLFCVYVCVCICLNVCLCVCVCEMHLCVVCVCVCVCVVCV